MPYSEHQQQLECYNLWCADKRDEHVLNFFYAKIEKNMTCCYVSSFSGVLSLSLSLSLSLARARVHNSRTDRPTQAHAHARTHTRRPPGAGLPGGPAGAGVGRGDGGRGPGRLPGRIRPHFRRRLGFSTV